MDKEKVGEEGLQTSKDLPSSTSNQVDRDAIS